jgi:predicted peroxiredoxin
MKKSIYLALLAVLFLAACTQTDKKQVVVTKMDSTMVPECCAMKDGMFIHISNSNNDPHRVVMPLKMATMMAMEKPVVVYFDIKGIEVVLKDAKDITYPTFPSSKESLKKLVDMKVTLLACPSCMKAAGKTEADLMPGVIMAEKDKFFNFTKGRIITLDY